MLQRAVAEEDKLRLLLVNNGSTGGTEDLLASLSESSAGSIDVMEVRRNGKGEAVRLGMRKANDERAR